MTEQEHKSPNAPDVLRASVLPAATLDAVLLGCGENRRHLLRCKWHRRRLLDLGAFQLGGRILVKPSTLMREAEESSEEFQLFERPEIAIRPCGAKLPQHGQVEFAEKTDPVVLRETGHLPG